MSDRITRETTVTSPYDPSIEELQPLGVSAGDEVDPELLLLPAPPRRERRTTLGLMAVTAACAAAMVVALLPDAAYAVRGERTPADLGDLAGVRPNAPALVPNSFVSAKGLLGGAAAIRFERPFEADSYRLAPVAGRDDVWVELRVPAGAENARFVPPSAFCGRLVPFEASGLRHRSLADAVTGVTRRPMPKQAWLLVDGEYPSGAFWVLALVLLFAGFAAWNVWTIARLVRKVK